jgi:hypothetical protein
MMKNMEHRKEQQNEAIRSAMRQEMMGKYGRDDLDAREQTEFLKVVDGLVGFLFQVGLQSIDDYDPARDLKKICKLVKLEEIDLFVDLMARLECLYTTGEILEVKRVIDDQEYAIDYGEGGKKMAVYDDLGKPYVYRDRPLMSDVLGPDAEKVSVEANVIKPLGVFKEGMFCFGKKIGGWFMIGPDGKLRGEFFKRYHSVSDVGGEPYLHVQQELDGPMRILRPDGTYVPGEYQNVGKIIPSPDGGIFFVATMEGSHADQTGGQAVYNEKGEKLTDFYYPSQDLQPTKTGFCIAMSPAGQISGSVVVTENGEMKGNAGSVIGSRGDLFFGEEGFHYVHEKKEKRFVRTLDGEEIGKEYEDVGIPVVVNGERYLPVKNDGRWHILHKDKEIELIGAPQGLFSIGSITPMGRSNEEQHFFANEVDSEHIYKGYLFTHLGNRGVWIDQKTKPEIVRLGTKDVVWTQKSAKEGNNEWHLFDFDKMMSVAQSEPLGFALHLQDKDVYLTKERDATVWNLRIGEKIILTSKLFLAEEVYSMEQIDDHQFYLMYKPPNENMVMKIVLDINDLVV